MDFRAGRSRVGLAEPAACSAMLGVTNVEQLESNAPAFGQESTPEERTEVAELAEHWELCDSW